MKIKLVLLLFVLIASYCQAQMVKPFAVNSTGGTAILGGNVYDWSFAEMAMISTNAGGNLIVTAGLLQPIDPNVGLEENQLLTDAIRVYPNPTNDLVNLETRFEIPGKLSYQLLDVSGKTLLNFNDNLDPGLKSSTISLAKQAAGEYFLRVSYNPDRADAGYIQTFKIQKIN